MVLLKIGKDNQIPHLDINSSQATANGSRIAAPTNPIIVQLDSEDLKFAAGVYDVEITVLDSSTGSVRTVLEKGVFVLHETQRGVLGL